MSPTFTPIVGGIGSLPYLSPFPRAQSYQVWAPQAEEAGAPPHMPQGGSPATLDRLTGEKREGRKEINFSECQAGHTNCFATHIIFTVAL